jgi:hypothetical protein
MTTLFLLAVFGAFGVTVVLGMVWRGCKRRRLDNGGPLATHTSNAVDVEELHVQLEETHEDVLAETEAVLVEEYFTDHARMTTDTVLVVPVADAATADEAVLSTGPKLMYQLCICPPDRLKWSGLPGCVGMLQQPSVWDVAIFPSKYIADAARSVLVTSGYLSTYPEPVPVQRLQEEDNSGCLWRFAPVLHPPGPPGPPPQPPHMRMYEDRDPVQHVVGVNQGILGWDGHPWRRLRGLVAFAPEIGVVPSGCVGLVFESEETAGRAFEFFESQGCTVAFPKPMPSELPPWVLLDQTVRE